MRANPNDSLRPSRGFVKGGDQIFVTIGRNVGTEPMSDHHWQKFQDLLADRLGALLLPTATFGPFYGRGEWDGVTEESAVFSLTVGYTTQVEHVESVLGQLADLFEQDAIAYSTAPTVLVERVPTTV